MLKEEEEDGLVTFMYVLLKRKQEIYKTHHLKFVPPCYKSYHTGLKYESYYKTQKRNSIDTIIKPKLCTFTCLTMTSKASLLSYVESTGVSFVKQNS